MENPIKLYDLGVPLFLETPMSRFHSLSGFLTVANLAHQKAEVKFLGLISGPEPFQVNV